MSPAPIVIAPTIVAAKRNRIIRTFRKAAAHSPETAQALETLSISRGHIFGRMVKSGVIREESDGKFWLDEAATREWSRCARVRVAIALGIAAVIVVVLVILK